MDPEHWRKIEELYRTALACNPEDRAVLLNRCDSDLRREVELLLARESSPPGRTITLSAPAAPVGPHPPLPAADLFSARFLPGAILAHRYRIVNLLGRGGMGEVYRAMDLTLGQSVALKFLPEAASHEPQARQRLFNEVRAAREITHPQVCRVHDIGEMEGQLYISMEFVDGEDLSSLLSRIGRLPAGKAGELAAGICAGLAAAHRMGLVHRDLKPANIMVDGRGQPRLMDFGLAANAETVDPLEVAYGTPLYMAPEQLAGKEVTFRSDLYALGLILYELFTGQRPFHGKSAADLLAAREKNAPVPVSTFCPDIAPAVESVIAACLSPDPASRPASARAVAAALPHHDALAAVIAAGDTPSPELIAASGDTRAVRPKVAYAAVAAILCGLFGGYLLRNRIGSAVEESPEVFANSARTFVRRLAYAAPVSATAYGFAVAETEGLPAISFWYRESETGLQPDRPGDFRDAPGRVTPADPPLQPGMRLVEMDARGRLFRFTAIPDSPPPANSQVDWKALFLSAGLDFSRFTETPAQNLPPVAADRVLSWTGSSADNPGLVVTAASWLGQVVYFQVIDPALHPLPQARPQRRRVGSIGAMGFICIALTALFFARRNLQRNRGDRKGAFRIGAATFWLCVFEWLLVASHSFALREAVMAASALSWAMAMASLAYLIYIAIDPTVRRTYPDMLVSLQQILTGGPRDALLGRDILCGLALAVLANLFEAAVALAAGAKVSNLAAPTPAALIGVWVGDLRLGIWVGLVALACFIPLFGFRRKRRMRFGALGVVIANTGIFCLRDMPAVPDASAWYAQGPLLGYAVFAALAIYAARLAAGAGRPPLPHTLTSNASA